MTRALMLSDVMSIKNFLRYLLDDNLIFDVQILHGKMTLIIMGKPGSIPDDVAEQIMLELKEYSYVGHTLDVPDMGQSIVVSGVE